MTTENNDERIRQAIDRSTPPLSPEVRKRALWAVMVVLRGGSRSQTAIWVVLLVLLLGAGVYAVVRFLLP